ncbi:MAG: hypothetical protein JWN45_94 [Acidobacteriaceae bacterium]|nr:hypothetical protein [Acidobacteriaceae bacterium]
MLGSISFAKAVRSPSLIAKVPTAIISGHKRSTARMKNVPAVLLFLALTANAIAQYEPQPPIAPVSTEECDRYSAAMHALWKQKFEEERRCSDQIWKTCRGSKDELACLNRYGPTEGNEQTSCGLVQYIYRSCRAVTYETACLGKRKSVGENQCNAKVRQGLSDAARQQRERAPQAKVDSHGSHSSAPTDSGTPDRPSASERIMGGVAAMVDRLSRQSNDDAPVAMDRDEAPSADSKDHGSTIPMPPPKQSGTNTETSYAADLKPMMTLDGAGMTRVILSEGLSNNAVAQTIVTTWSFANKVDDWAKFAQGFSANDSKSPTMNKGLPTSAVSELNGRFNPYAVSQELSSRSIGVFTNISDHALSDFNAAMGNALSQTISAVGSTYDRSTQVLRVPYVDSSPQSVVLVPNETVSDDDLSDAALAQDLREQDTQ